MENNHDNRLRSIKHLAVLDGWFKPEEDSENRYRLHLNASFRSERLGGTEESNIRFRIELKQCEIVVMLPEKGAGFSVDPSTIARTLPNSTVRVTNKTHAAVEAEAGVEAGYSEGKPKGSIFAKGKGKYRKSTETEDTSDVPLMVSQHSMSEDKHRSWLVTSPRKVLSGSLWDPDLEPRFTMIDKRLPATIKDERDKNLSPNAVVQVRCKREDVHIYEIRFKELEREGLRQNRANQETRQRAAEAFLKAEIQRQRLSVGDIYDVFSDMTLAEYMVPLFE